MRELMMGKLVFRVILLIVVFTGSAMAQDSDTSMLDSELSAEEFFSDTGQQRSFLSAVGFEGAENCPSFIIKFSPLGVGGSDMNIYGSGPVKVLRDIDHDKGAPELDDPRRILIWSETPQNIEGNGPICVIDLTYRYRLIEKSDFGKKALLERVD